MDFYTANAQALTQQYQALNPELVHCAWLKHLPTTASHALDIGAGAGRDALWLAKQGWQVTAIEPNKALRQNIPQHHNITTAEVFLIEDHYIGYFKRTIGLFPIREPHQTDESE